MNIDGRVAVWKETVKVFLRRQLCAFNEAGFYDGEKVELGGVVEAHSLSRRQLCSSTMTSLSVINMIFGSLSHFCAHFSVGSKPGQAKGRQWHYLWDSNPNRKEFGCLYFGWFWTRMTWSDLGFFLKFILVALWRIDCRGQAWKLKDH